MCDDDIDSAMICPATKEPCIRSFCDDYGCANLAGVELDENDFACGSINRDELVVPLPKATK
jgi:hypothetical protein